MPMAGKFLLHVKKTAYNPAGQTVPFRIPKHKRPIDEKQEKPGEEEKPDGADDVDVVLRAVEEGSV